jgi:hypothetical protein
VRRSIGIERGSGARPILRDLDPAARLVPVYGAAFDCAVTSITAPTPDCA